jgi:NTE family protein
MLRNLAIKGGGVRGVAFVGALRALDNAGMLNNLQRVAGTSAGSMLAAMIAAGYDVEAVDGLMSGMDFSKFQENLHPLGVVTHYGIYSGNYILDFTKAFLEASPKGLSADCTFADLRNAGCKDLYVFATDLNAFSVAEFSADITPDVKVAEAVRASMSIPIYFKAWQFPDHKPNDHIYVDGGVVFNYPLSFFDSSRFCDAEWNDQAIGLFLQSKATTEAQFGYDHIMHYSRHLFEMMLNSQDVDFEQDHCLLSRSVVIDDLGFTSTDFHLTDDDKKRLSDSGAKAAQAYILQKATTQQPTLVPVI